MTETVERTATGAILYDQSVINQISESHFTADGWPHAALVDGRLGSGGRGNTMYVGNVPRQFVLRHYVRGGLVGKLIRDRYLFKGEDATRAFAEWRMLAKMADFNLRVPRPAAAASSGCSTLTRGVCARQGSGNRKLSVACIVRLRRSNGSIRACTLRRATGRLCSTAISALRDPRKGRGSPQAGS